ncbi:MAG: class I adenylate-forming enzyme family protein [Betaproteobacteria bacterium]
MKFSAYLALHETLRGDKLAISCQQKQLNFRELNQSSTQLANSLQELEILVGDRVVIYLHNSVEFVQAFLAIVKAGGIAVPINTMLVASEIEIILNDCTPKAAFISDRTRDVFIKASKNISKVHQISIDSVVVGEYAFASLVASGRNVLRESPYDFDDCMICYTSGTTGSPKGAILTQANFIVLNNFLNSQLWGLSDQERQLVTTPLAHRTGFARVMNMILHGCSLMVMPRFDAALAKELTHAHKITLIGLVPTVGRMLLDSIESEPELFESVKVILATGEAFPIDIKKRLSQALPNARIYSFYAMTEAGGIAHLNHDDQLTHMGSVGTVTPGLELKLVDKNGNEVANGEVGEIVVRSGIPGSFLIMRAYFNKPRETAEAIQQGWFYTGDMGKLDSDSYLYLVDRKKDMVLSGGYNIYSKEVELTILRCSGVKDVAVIGVPDLTFGEAVVAVIERSSNQEVNPDDIIQFCRTNLASYKKPKHVFFLDSLPRTSTGKVLKAELRKQVGILLSNQ